VRPARERARSRGRSISFEPARNFPRSSFRSGGDGGGSDAAPHCASLARNGCCCRLNERDAARRKFRAASASNAMMNALAVTSVAINALRARARARELTTITVAI